MTRDAIVDEVRTFRDEIAREYDYDIGAIFAALRQMEATSKGHHVSLAQRSAVERSPAEKAGVADPPPVTDNVASGRR